MRSALDDAATVLQRIRAEFREMPGLKLTAAQATRLWHLDPNHSEALLNTLVIDGVLRQRADGAYLVSSSEHTRARFLKA
jgi:hypothetical protein